MSSLSQTVVNKSPLVKIKEAWAVLCRLVKAPVALRAALRRYWYLPVLLLVLGCALQFVVIPLTDVALEKIYPPVKEKKLFGLYEKTSEDTRLASRKSQFRLAWWVLFSGSLAAGLVMVAPRLLRESTAGENPSGVSPENGSAGRYQIREEIGRGAMGVVYSAHDTVLQREVAVKELPESLLQDTERRERFKREALTLARLSHKGIVNIFDLIEDHHKLMLVMELVEGGSLDDFLVPGVPMAASDAARLVSEMAEALGYIHSRDIIHRDLKPANVLVDASGGLKLTDFGLARICQDSSLTVAGSIIGSPLYMSPEQAVGRKADHRSDIYALGIIFYQLLTGAPPFEGDHQEVLSQHLSVAPEPPALKVEDVPEGISGLVMQMIEKVVEERIDNCEEIVARLKPFTV